MRLSFEDIKDRHLGRSCVVALHGPSLSEHIEKIQRLQEEQNFLRFSVNEWFDFFEKDPDYWVVSNTEFNIRDSVENENIWKQRGYPVDVFNKYNIPLLYNCAADLTDLSFVEDKLSCDYLPYDNKHFKGDTCKEILFNFKKHYEDNKNLDYKAYGDNSQMWQIPNVKGVNPYCAKVHGGVASGWSKTGNCCHLAEKSNVTIQEYLQSITGHSQHMGVGHTVGLFSIMMAVIMGCETIYVTGLDLDYTLGYATGGDKPHYIPNAGNIGHWKQVYRDFLLDDIRILRESAELRGIKIINLNHNAWYDEFKKGDFIL